MDQNNLRDGAITNRKIMCSPFLHGDIMSIEPTNQKAWGDIYLDVFFFFFVLQVVLILCVIFISQG